MAFYIHDDVLDDGLQTLTDDVTELHICSALPSDRADCLTKSLGQKTSPTVNAPSAYSSPSGRQVVVDEITDGDVDGTGTASHWALISGSLLLAAQTLSSGVSVTSGHKFTLDEFFIAIPTG